MRHPQVVVFETDGALAHYLESLAAEGRWLLRESRQGPACLNLLRAGGPSVLVLKLGRHLLRELAMLDEIHTALPDVGIVAIGDSEDATLMALALELGASFVVQPPQSRQQLAEVVTCMMKAAIVRAAMQTAPRPATLPPEPEAARESQS